MQSCPNHASYTLVIEARKLMHTFNRKWNTNSNSSLLGSTAHDFFTLILSNSLHLMWNILPERIKLWFNKIAQHFGDLWRDFKVIIKSEIHWAFFFFGCISGKWKFQGQGSNQSCNCNLRSSCSNAGSLTHCARPGIEPKPPQQRQPLQLGP